jgi:hypothetical protein
VLSSRAEDLSCLGGSKSLGLAAYLNNALNNTQQHAASGSERSIGILGSRTVWDRLFRMRKKTFYQQVLKLGANEASAQGL